MKKIINALTLSIIIAVCATFSAFAQESNEKTRIGSVVDLYEQALNSNNVERMLQLFTEDGVAVLQGVPTTIGTEALETFYISLFKMLDFNLKFDKDEVIQMSSEWAFVRTTSAGTVTILSNNSENPSEGHELFILKKQADGDWKIARYTGSSAK